MTSEPDEALIWAREQSGDDAVFSLADAYRAGQAASAERIKALEEEVAFSRKIAARCTEELEWVRQQRALLKEVDHD